MKRDFTYVDDVAEAVVRLVDRPAAPDPAWSGAAPDPATSFAPWRIYNIGNHTPVEVTEVVRLLEAALGRRAIIELAPMQPGDVTETCADVVRSRGCGRFPAADRRSPRGCAVSSNGMSTIPGTNSAARPAVFFDRDGTLTVDTGYVHRPQDLVFIPGAIAAVKRVNELGYYAFLVTNQSGVARGYFTEDDVRAFHEHLQAQLRAAGAHLDDIRYCPHPRGRSGRRLCAPLATGASRNPACCST